MGNPICEETTQSISSKVVLSFFFFLFLKNKTKTHTCMQIHTLKVLYAVTTARAHIERGQDWRSVTALPIRR